MASMAIARTSAAAVLSRKMREFHDSGATMSRDALLTRGDVIVSTSISSERRSPVVVKLDEPPIEGPMPGWVMPTAEAFADLLELPVGWNSYNANAVDPRAIELAGALLAGVMEESTPPPTVVPTVRGGVQLEWHRNGLDLEIAVHSHRPVAVFAIDNRSGEEWESEWIPEDRRLSNWVQRL